MQRNAMPIVEALMTHYNNQPVSFHVPGHKNGMLISQEDEGLKFMLDVMKIDQTELTGLDDLHAPEEAIEEAQMLLADLYQTKRSFFLVNGSTVGNLAMILASFDEGDQVLVQRNSHKSIMNGLELANVQPIYISPDIDPIRNTPGGVHLDSIKNAIQQFPDIKGIVLTYPNYYGGTYDLKSIIEFAHKRNMPLLVDEAHGAHFIIGDGFPPSAVKLGADIVVQSAHKTLPALTMGSYLHFNSSLISLQRVKDYLSMLQSSSPSYPIMASLDLARYYLNSYTRDDSSYLLDKIKDFINSINQLQFIKAVNGVSLKEDPLKITIQSSRGLTGFQVQKALEKFHVYPEMADIYNVLLMFPLLKKGMEYPQQEVLYRLKAADKLLGDIMPKPSEKLFNFQPPSAVSTTLYSYKELRNLKEESVPLRLAKGLIALESIIPYPPGIPLLLKGEIISESHIEMLEKLIGAGASFHGGSLLKENKIIAGRA